MDTGSGLLGDALGYAGIGLRERQYGLLGLLAEAPLFIRRRLFAGDVLNDRCLDFAFLDITGDALKAVLLPEDFEFLLPQKRLLDIGHVLKQPFRNLYAGLLVLQN